MNQTNIFDFLKQPKTFLVAFTWLNTKLGFPEFRGTLLECRKYLHNNFKQTRTNNLTIIKDYYEKGEQNES